MALSNWDCLAIGPDSKGCEGTFNAEDSSIQIYKNWASVHYKKMPGNAGKYREETVATINSGDLTVLNFSITAIRHDLQNSIFLFAAKWNSELKKSEYFAGIGCYGYWSDVKGYLEWKGVKQEYADYTTDSRNFRRDRYGNEIKLKEFVDYIILEDEKGFRTEIEVDKEFGELTRFVGVMPETLAAFRTWLETDIAYDESYNTEFDKWIKSINWDAVQRYNQGDAFFSSAGQVMTSVGNQGSDTILSSIIKNMGTDEKQKE